MILHRQVDSLGITELGWIRARHHFRFAGAQNVDLLNWGPLRAVNHNILAPNAATTPVTHYGTEVLHIVEDGTIDFVRSNGETSRVRSGQILSTYAGSGLHFSIANALKIDAVYTEIWLNCEAPHDPAVVRRLSRIQPQGAQVIAGSGSNTGSYQLKCPATITKYAVSNQRTVAIPITTANAYAFVLSGAVMINDTRIARHEGVAMQAKQALHVSAERDAQFILIEMP